MKSLMQHKLLALNKRLVECQRSNIGRIKENILQTPVILYKRFEVNKQIIDF